MAEDRAVREYQPSDDDKTLIETVNGKFDQWRQDRKPHESQWFVNAAFLRGNQSVEWDAVQQRLNVSPAPSHRQRLKINRVLPKFRARLAKFLKARPQPQVIPATTEREDRLNAKATQKALDYLWRKLRLEAKYKDALTWSGTAGKGFWWFYWDGQKTARIREDNPLTGPQTVTAPVGDVAIEVGTPFELLVPDQGITHIGDQPEIMRARMRDVNDVKARYPKLADYLSADTSYQDIYHYERQIAGLNAKGATGFGLTDVAKGGEKAPATHVIVKELFSKPCGKYPQGRYIVVCGSVLLRSEDALPYEFDGDNPYPVIEFCDLQMAGQFWPTTVVEQLVSLQREYNLIRSKIAEQLRLMAFPKLLAARQHQIPEGAWTSEAGEFVEYIAIPGIPPPAPWHPPNIAGDAWKTLELIKSEFEDLTHIYASVEGGVGGSQSGFQTNLLQEAADSVHAPDIRGHELAIEEAAHKMRQLMKLGYDVPRLITILGRNHEPEVMEFSSSMIDSEADIVVQAGSSLPMMKAQKINSVIELWKAGMLGEAGDPESRRRSMKLLEMGEFETFIENERRDEDEARLENAELLAGAELKPPQFFQNHTIHYQIHTDELKSPEMRNADPQLVEALIAHTILTLKFTDPVGAYNLAAEYGMEGLVPPPQPMLPPAGSAPAGPPPPGGGAPPDAPPPPPQ